MPTVSKPSWFKLNPKIQAAAITALAVAGITVGNEAISVYGDRWWEPIVAALLVALAGWYKKDTSK